jgi:hypothetical protein
MFRISRWIAAGLLLTAAAHAQDHFDKTLSGTVDYRGGTVTIEHRFGRVEVRTSNNDVVTARAAIRSSDAEWGRQVRFSVSNSGNGVTIRTLFPEGHSHRGENLSYSADLEVTIPARAPLRLTNRFGSVDVDGLRAAGEIVNGQGPVTLRNSRGTQTIENSFGSITVENIAGDTTVQNANGSVTVTKIDGTLSVSDRFGSVSVRGANSNVAVANTNGTVEVSDTGGPTSISNTFANIVARNIGGQLTLTNQNGRVEVSDVKGPATIRSSFASIDVRGVNGPADIANANGNVAAIDIRGKLSVDTRFGLVKVERVRGALDVDNQNGSVTASDINGAARVHTSYSPVFLKGIDGSVDVENQNGSISVSGLRRSCSPISLRTAFAPIKVAIPRDAGYDVDARTSYGSINTDVPITLTRKNENTLAGTIGNGGCKLDLATSNGSITITRE